MILTISVVLTLTLLLFALYTFYRRDSEIMNSTIAQNNTIYLVPYAIAYLLISVVLYSNIIFNKSDLWKTSLVVLILLHFLTLIIIKLKAWQTQLGQGSVVFRIKQNGFSDTLSVFIFLFLIFSAFVTNDIHSMYPFVYGYLFNLFISITRLASYIEIREHGISGGFFALRWQDIDFLVWQEDIGIVHIQHHALWPINRRLQMKLTEDVKDTELQFLMRYLPSACSH